VVEVRLRGWGVRACGRQTPTLSQSLFKYHSIYSVFRS
jgi:hypothetical protein